MSDTKKWAALSREVTADIAKVERRLARLGVPTKEVDRWADKCWRLYANVLINADKEAR